MLPDMQLMTSVRSMFGSTERTGPSPAEVQEFMRHMESQQRTAGQDTGERGAPVI